MPQSVSVAPRVAEYLKSLCLSPKSRERISQTLYEDLPLLAKSEIGPMVVPRSDVRELELAIDETTLKFAVQTDDGAYLVLNVYATHPELWAADNDD